MATITICDRCGASATTVAKPVNISIPASNPATNPGAVDRDVSVLVQTPDSDLCTVCLASVLTEFVLLRLGKSALTNEVVAALSKRIKAALGDAG